LVGFGYFYEMGCLCLNPKKTKSIMASVPSLVDLIKFLSDKTSYDLSTDKVSILQTHISVVSLTSQFVYKLKKSVRFDFLDFSTLPKRLFYCQEEVRLNQRLTTELYLGILPIYWDGKKLSFKADGEVVEYVIKMRRLSDEHLLINRLKSPDFPLSQMDLLANRLLTFYQNTPTSPEISAFASIESIKTTLLEITSDFPNCTGQTLSPLAARWIETALFRFIESNKGLLEARIQLGKIIEGHGDLRSEHVHIEHNTVTIYDCIEFSQRLRCLDWLNDFAFLLMDLEYRHCYLQAVYLQHKLLAVLEKDDVSLLLNIYKIYRACVRGKVDTIKFREPEVALEVRLESQQKAARYYQLAFRYAVLGSVPTVILCMGGGATGKSALATALANEFGLSVLSSDVVRKQRAGIDLFKRLPDAERVHLYEPRVTDGVYQELADKGLAEIDKFGVVILDATYRNKEYLKQLQEICQQKSVRLVVIQTMATEKTIRERLKKRETEPTISDLRNSDYVSARFEIEYPIEDYVEFSIKVDTHRPIEALINDAIIPRLMR